MALDLVVTEITLPDFLEKTSKTQAAQIRALTISIDYDRLVSPDHTCEQHKWCTTSIHDSLTAQALWNYLRNLARALQHMTALTTFAITITRHKCIFWLPRDILTDLVQNLPPQCRNLEIDTNKLDQVREEFGVDDHLCKAISHIVPNLQHLRLRLTAMCPVLFRVASAPILETVSVVCIHSDPLDSETQTCKTIPDAPATRLNSDGQEVAPHIARSLRALVASTHCPLLKLATVTDVTTRDWEDSSTHDSYSIRDALANKTYASPFVRTMWGAGCNIWLRARDGEEVMATRATISLLAEGLPWKESIDGLRLPASFFLGEDSPYTVKPLHTATVAEYKARNPTRFCKLWVNEEKTGCRLVDSETFEGLGEHAPLREDTPEGFVRYDEKKSILVAVAGG